ncbi:hypothetical protein V490_01973 [Pseudogymnoascus sp. VKM F-3557]|nr:hypothetical protein V490_01973 [Pseudogymnoascus sp. VKM F-3557]
MQDMLYDVALTYTLNPGILYEEQTVLQWAALESKQRKCTLAALVGKGADIYVKGVLGTLLHDVAAWARARCRNDILHCNNKL